MLAVSIPIVFLVTLSLWLWTLCDVLREQRPYPWLISLLVIPPVTVFFYILNFKILDDEKNGVGYYVKRWNARARIAQIREELKEAERHGLWEELAGLLFELEEWEECLPAVAHMLEFDADSLKAQWWAGYCLYQTGHPERAKEHLEYVLEESPVYQNARPTLLLSGILRSEGRWEEAAEALNKAYKRQELPSVAVSLAECLIELKRQEEALEILKKALDWETNTGNVDAGTKKWISHARTLIQEQNKR